MKYDKNYVAKYRPLSIQKVEELVIGETYYGNESFILRKLETTREHFRNRKILLKDWHDDIDEIAWMLVRWENRGAGASSLHDRGIGIAEPYNPWLVFKDAAIAREYYAGLEVRF